MFVTFCISSCFQKQDIAHTSFSCLANFLPPCTNENEPTYSKKRRRRKKTGIDNIICSPRPLLDFPRKERKCFACPISEANPGNAQGGRRGRKWRRERDRNYSLISIAIRICILVHVRIKYAIRMPNKSRRQEKAHRIKNFDDNCF